MIAWLRKAWVFVTKPIRQAATYIRSRVGTGWKVVKAACAVLLAGVVVRSSPVLALALMTVPWTRRVKNDYGKVFVGFAVAVIGSILLLNGVVVFADLGILLLAFAMYEMLTRWWDHVQVVEAQT